MHTTNGKTTRIIALCGKGGVGKTSISALISRILADLNDKKVLAIDADPAVGLSTALGINIHKTVDDVRQDLISRFENGEGGSRQEILSQIDYEMFTALKEKDNLAFLAIGRPEKEGCYCQINHMLKDIIASIASQFDYVVIDGEAGVEQVNRRVMEKVTHLLLVSDQSKKGLEVVKTIKKVSDDTIEYESAGLILNKIRTQDEANNISVPKELTYIGWVPETDVMRKFDMEGRSVLEMPESQMIHSVRTCMKEIGIIQATN